MIDEKTKNKLLKYMSEEELERNLIFWTAGGRLPKKSVFASSKKTHTRAKMPQKPPRGSHRKAAIYLLTGIDLFQKKKPSSSPAASSDKVIEEPKSEVKSDSKSESKSKSKPKSEPAVEKTKKGCVCTCGNCKLDKAKPKPADKKDNKSADKKDSKSAASNNSNKASNGKADDGKGKSVKIQDGKTEVGDKPHLTLTKDDDKKILEMKAKGTSWKEIAKALGKSQDIIKKRFNEIATDEQKAANQGKAGKKGAKKGNAADAKNTNAAAPAVTQEPAAASNAAAGAASSNWNIQDVPEPDTQSERGFVVFYPDEIFTEEDLIALAEALYDDHDRTFWRLSHRIFDVTGHLIEPADIKTKLTGRAHYGVAHRIIRENQQN